jgi:hypothetical protein
MMAGKVHVHHCARKHAIISRVMIIGRATYIASDKASKISYVLDDQNVSQLSSRTAVNQEGLQR